MPSSDQSTGQPQSRHAPPASLTHDNLRRVLVGYYNDREYFARNENFERVPLGQPTSRRSGKEMVEDFEAQWKRASACNKGK